MSAYELACGCVLRKNGVRLYREHGVYHVISGPIWVSFNLYSEAMRFFKEITT